MRASNVAKGLIIASAFLAVFSGIIAAFTLNYPAALQDGSDTYAYAQVNQTQALATQIRNSFTPSQNSNILDIFSNYLSLAIQTLRFIFSSVPIVGNMINSAGTLIGVDPIFLDLAITLFVFGLGFALWNMVTRWFN